MSGSGNETWLPDDLAPGADVVLALRKYDGTAHWTFDATFLGVDAHGAWLGGGPGTVIARPGRRFDWDNHFVVQVPRDRWYVLTMNAPTKLVNAELYADITTVPTWRRGDGPAHAARVEAVDLDLDVLRPFGEDVPVIVDEDEFEDHRVAMGYPEEVVREARHEAVRLLLEMREQAEPFATVARRWLDDLSA